jgi:hypothetical protein
MLPFTPVAKRMPQVLFERTLLVSFLSGTRVKGGNARSHST